MSLFALVTWIITAAVGLYLLSIWLIEYDKEFQSVAATRLPPAVLTSHALLAIGGLAVWVCYVIFDSGRLAWIAVVALVPAATLGLVMAVRWVGVYRAGRAGQAARDLAARDLEARQAGHLTQAYGPVRVAVPDPRGGSGPRGGLGPPGGPAAPGRQTPPGELGPPERNFPLPVVIAHGAFAAATIALVLLTALGVGAS